MNHYLPPLLNHGLEGLITRIWDYTDLGLRGLHGFGIDFTDLGLHGLFTFAISWVSK